MQRYNTYHGQVVLESDVDTWFDAVEDAEHNLVIDLAANQALLAGSPSSNVYGGIVSGLVVTGTPADDHVDITLGTARDNLGRRVRMGSNASAVKITHSGTMTAGVGDAAVGTVAITGSCSSGKYIVATLFIVYAETLSDPKVDATGSTVYYDIAETWQFEITIGTEYTAPPAAAPTRPSLQDGKVALCDLVLTNSGGNMQLVNVINSAPEWKALTGAGYKDLSGRRSDWLVVTNEDEFDGTADDALDVIRAESAREALYQLGKRVNSCAVTVAREAAAPALFAAMSKFGHPAQPHVLFDDFTYHSSAPDLSNGLLGDHLTITAIGSALSPSGNDVDIALSGYPGGVIRMGTNTTVSNGEIISTTMHWNLGASPRCILSCRFALDETVNATFAVGLSDSPGSATHWGLFKISGGNFVVEMATGGVGGTPVTLAAADTSWHTIRLAFLEATKAYAQLDTGAWTAFETAGGNMASTDYFLDMTLISTTGSARRYAYVDHIYIADAELISGLIP